MIRIAVASNPLHAQLLLGLLEGHGIRACVQGEALWGARGELPMTPDSAPSVWVVEKTDAVRAREILAAHEARTSPTRCRECGYDLRGQGDPRCPECGTAFLKQETWTCPDCGEVLTTRFTNCWKCDAEREDLEESLAVEPAVEEGIGTVAALPQCLFCEDTGRAKRPLAPMISLVFGLFSASCLVTAVKDLLEGIIAKEPVELLVQSILFACMAIIGIIAARKLRYAPCKCANGDGAK